MKIWGINKKYKSLSWFENFMSGHLNIGKRITIYGCNAMYWVLIIYTKKYGHIHITLPAFGRKGQRGYCMYFSPNSTPWACTFYIGFDKNESIRARIRKYNFGHNFNTDHVIKKLRKLNDIFSEFMIQYF